MPTRKESSEKLIGLGMTLTPLRGKNPYLKGWNSKEYTSEEWDRYHGLKGTNFGLVTGARSLKIVCVDIDPRNGGLVWLDAHPQILDDCGIIEESGRGDKGLHLFFIDIEGAYQKSCNPAKGVDYLAHGKQVVLAPSIHPDTMKPYTKVKGDLESYFMHITPLPDWLKSLLDAAGAAKKRDGDQTPFELSGEIEDSDRVALVNQLADLHPGDKSRHNTISKWVTDAVGSMMPDPEIKERAERWLLENGREAQAGEIHGWIVYAKKGFEDGTSYISNNLVNAKRFMQSDDNPNGFTPVLSSDEPDPNTFGPNASGPWEGYLISGFCKKAGKNVVKKSLHNIQTLLEMHPDLKGRVALNEMFNLPVKAGDKPFTWDSPNSNYGHNSTLAEMDYARIHSWFSRSKYRWETKDSELSKAILNAAGNNPIHPTRDWLYSLKWDKTPRLDKWLSDVTRCDDTEYHSHVGRLLIVSIASRILNPGVKWDNCVILEGPQRCGKSTLCEVLAGGDEYFVDTLEDLKDSKETVERTLGRTVVELPEIDKYFNRFSSSILKTWLSTKTETCRLAYARAASVNPRSFIVMGTTNKSTYLMDTTGERRYFPVKTGYKFFKIEKLKEERDQLFAEAVFIINRDGQRKALEVTEHLYDLQTEINAKRTLVDPWINTVVEYLLGLTGEREFYIKDILDTRFHITEGKQTVKDVGRIKRVLSQLGCWEVKDAEIGKARHWVAPKELKRV